LAVAGLSVVALEAADDRKNRDLKGVVFETGAGSTDFDDWNVRMRSLILGSSVSLSVEYLERKVEVVVDVDVEPPFVKLLPLLRSPPVRYFDDDDDEDEAP
jgi:hypothetical protein